MSPSDKIEKHVFWGAPISRVPPERRERAFRMNDSGWAAQTESIKKYVEEK